jgi:hypothetical protein
VDVGEQLGAVVRAAVAPGQAVPEGHLAGRAGGQGGRPPRPVAAQVGEGRHGLGRQRGARAVGVGGGPPRRPGAGTAACTAGKRVGGLSRARNKSGQPQGRHGQQGRGHGGAQMQGEQAERRGEKWGKEEQCQAHNLLSHLEASLP